ncbi:huntingtin [Lingula anatina]|uniref:Huntingtin n=1 Tax=Lingula anatina TaxID=7574 RepID=A0A1S3ILB0_LINAN|nr:huntingtin [Lingula anatina]|eukprot:XP_013398873.1 huntingtin [Lingula anatina]
MASLEKLVKALETLRVFQPEVTKEDATKKFKEQLPVSKKDKITSCNVVAETICSTSLRTLAEFPKFLGIAIESFLLFCDDAESDVRMVADDCLNRTIKNLIDTNLGRLQVELYKEIKKNGSSRSLRAALWRFAELCSLIRPQKCRPYVVNLLPCISRICKRPEEAVQETLNVAMQKMAPVLMVFCNDVETKSLAKAFIPNLKSSSAPTRRTAANAVTLICQHGRKPTHFIAWMLGMLIGQLVPVCADAPTHAILGVLLGLRHLLPHLGRQADRDLSLKGSFGKTKREDDAQISTHQILQIYELLLFYTDHPDHNVNTAALETLHQMLRFPPPQLLHILVTPGTITQSTIYQDEQLGRPSSELDLAVSSAQEDTNLDEESEGSESSTALSGHSSEPIMADLAEDELTSRDVTAEGEAQGTGEEAIVDVQLDEDEEEVDGTVDEAYSNLDIGNIAEDPASSQSSSMDTLLEIRPSPSHKPNLERSSTEDRLNANVDIDEDEPQQVTTQQQNSCPVKTGNIGDFISLDEAPITYCARLLCSKFLLTGYPEMIFPDRVVRVSIKAQALACLSNVLAAYPRILFLKLHVNDESSQNLHDILLYANHHDHQLKGTTAVLIGSFIQAVLKQAGGRFDVVVKQYQTEEQGPDFVTLSGLLNTLIVILEDDSAVAARLAIMATKLCLSSVLNSIDCELGLKTLIKVLQLKSNPYWLVKVELLDLLSEIDFKVVSFLENTCMEVGKDGHHFIGSLNLQQRVLEDVVLYLLADEDTRVRTAAATALVKLVPNLFFPVDHPQQDPVIAKSKEFTDAFLDPVLHEWSQDPQPLLHGLVEPYHFNPYRGYSEATEGSLSRVLALLTRVLTKSSSKYLTYGCCHALCELSEAYRVTQYADGWGCTYSTSHNAKDYGGKPHKRSASSRPSSTSSISVDELTSSGCGPLSIVLSLLTSSVAALDIAAHQDALQLAGNLFAGASFKCLKNEQKGSPTNATADDTRWSALQDRQLLPLVEQLLAHVARLLNIFTHIIDGQVPGPPQTRPTLPSLPNAPSLSPMKRKSKLKDDLLTPGNPVAASDTKSSQKTPGKEKEKDGDKEKSKKEGIGVFYNLPQYVKFYEVLKGAHSNYQSTLDLGSTDKFCSLLKTTLDVLSQLLEIATLQEVGKYTDELLGFLKTTFGLEAKSTVLCVQQLLKSLFGTNLSSQWDSGYANSLGHKPSRMSRLAGGMQPGLYHSCLTTPYTHFTQSLAATAFKTAPKAEEEDSSSLLGWLKKRSERKIPAILKPGSKTDKNAIAAYIRLFEALVIKSLKQYTVTTSLGLQQQVLDLLAQLVQLRVNYCLLDSDQIFIGFVIKQFEYVEEGQISGSELLIPHIFNFLVLLSYERYHSKTIIGMPKIIQLCDGIMASGQPPVTHAIPALQPIVYDLFVLRTNKADTSKDVDTQREVVVSMLLRLIHYYQVLELLIVVLHQCHKENEEKWKRLSRQVTDMVLPLLAKQQINLDSQPALDVLHRLFDSVAPSVFRPVDILLRSLFAPPYDVSCSSSLSKWLCLVLSVLRVLISQSKEDVVLSRLQELSLRINIYTDTATCGQWENKAARQQDGMTPEETFARFLLQVVGVVGQQVACSCTTLVDSNSTSLYLCQQLAHFLLYVTHMFQSGQFRKVATSAMSLIKQQVPDYFYSVQELNKAFKEMSSIHPTLTLQWSNVLILLNYEEQHWWSDIMQTPRKYVLSSPARHYSNIPENFLSVSRCSNMEIVRRGGLVLFCDYVCENLNDAEHMTWVIINHVSDLIELSHEPPVQDFISAVHRNSAASGLFVQAIHSRCDNLAKPSVVKKTLQCLEAIHLSQSGALLTLLIDKFLHTYHVAGARMCDALACRRVELLLADSVQECSNQLPLEDLDKLLQFMQTAGLTRRHGRLSSLLMKLRSVLSPHQSPPPELQLSHPLQSGTTTRMSLTKENYLQMVKAECFSVDARTENCASFLQHLDYSDILTVMMTKDFHLGILEQCISIGRKNTLQNMKNLQLTESTEDSDSLHPVLQASQLTLLRHINNIINMLPVPHQVLSYSEKQTSQEDSFLEKMEDFFTDTAWLENVNHLTAALVEYIKTLRLLPWKPQIPEESVRDVARFAVLNMEIVHWLLNQDQIPASGHLETSLRCFCAVLQNQQSFTVIGSTEHVTWVCSVVRAVHQLLVSMVVIPGEQLATLPNHENTEDSTPRHRYNGFHHIIRSCDQISELLHCLRTHLRPRHAQGQLSPYVSGLLRNIVVSLARLPLVNSYARTPPLVWKLGWMPAPGGETKTKLPPLPLDFLQEKDVLREFIFRVNVVGWTSRQQFEETWMCLLGVLNPALLEEEQHPVSPEEEVDRTQCIVLAVRCITALLLQSTLTPDPGNPCNGVHENQPRDKPLAFMHTRCGKRLLLLRSIIERDLRHLCLLKFRGHTSLSGQERDLFGCNLERELGLEAFTMGQFCIESIWSVVGMLNFSESGSSEDDQELSVAMTTRGRSSSHSGLDLHSCVQFLVDLYGQWLTPGVTPRTPLMLINQTVKSVVAISDLFTERQQFEWMLDTLMDVFKCHPQEDEVTVQYLVVGICKAAAITGVTGQEAEKVEKVVESTLKSPHIPSRIAALHGCLYILETGINDLSRGIIPDIMEYLVKQMEIIGLMTVHCQQHLLVMWSTAFFLIENFQEEIKDTEFASRVLQVAVSLATSGEDVCPFAVYLVILRGLERLVLANVISGQDTESLIKLAVDRLCLPSPQRALAALGLMLTCMYAGKQGDQYTPSVHSETTFFIELPAEVPIPQDPESLIVAMERVTVLFDRIRKGFPFEAQVLTQILPSFLTDFFPPQDIMNKVIGEFLSSQQPHPQLMARVVFEVFAALHKKKQQSLVQDWVMLSLSNFTQRTPIAMAIWSLTCFFISASTNQWLRALFRHVESRMGKLEEADCQLFHTAALDFYDQLSEEGQRRAFQSTFQAVGQTGSPYADLVASWTH